MSRTARDEEPLRVLAIDDDPGALLLVEDVLQRRGGLAVTALPTPAEALQRLRDSEFDVLVTDVELPGMTGLELLGRLRADHPALPVVVITANPTVEYAVEALRGQAGEFLPKPLDPDVLLRTVVGLGTCLLYTSPSPRDRTRSRMPSSA